MNELERRIHQALDQRIGRDLITAVSEVRRSFGLSHKEFYPIYLRWVNS